MMRCPDVVDKASLSDLWCFSTAIAPRNQGVNNYIVTVGQADNAVIDIDEGKFQRNGNVLEQNFLEIGYSHCLLRNRFQ